MNSETLKEFRQAAYELLVKAKDATFELMDAVMTTRNAACLAEFALSPLFNRQWSSSYEALQDSRPDRKKLMVLYIRQLEQQVPAPEYVLVALDHTAWGRPDAKTLKDRTQEYQDGVVVGQGYSTIAWIPEAQGSWALPLLHERISSDSSPIAKAAAQLKQVCEQLANPVLAVLDREYGNATWVLAQAQSKADCLMRVRKNACFWSAPPAYSGRGRPRKHGQKIKLNDPETWLEPDATLEIDEHPQLGSVRIQQWQDLHFYRAAGHLVNLILIERIKPIQSMFSVLVEIGTPAQSPKPRGKSPGWAKGNTRTKPLRYPTVQKRVSRLRKTPKVAA